jgi:hypothetical protein
VNPLLFLFAELCVWSAGLGVAAFLLPSRPVSRIEWTGLALLVGSGVVSLTLFTVGWVLQGGALVTVVAVASGALGAAGIFRWRKAGPVPLRGGRWFLAGLIVMLILIGWQAGNHPLTADGLFNFEIRAQLAALHGGRIPAGFFSDPSRAWMHPNYPLFLPLNQAWIYLCLGGPNQGWAQLLSVHFAAGAACLLFSGVTRLTGEAWRGGLAVGMLFLLPAAMNSPGGAISLWADFPLAAVFLGAVIYLVEFAATGCGLALFAAFLGLLPWVKREGMVLAGVLALALLWSLWKRGPIALIGLKILRNSGALRWIVWKEGTIRQFSLAVLPLAIVVLGWKIFLGLVHVSADRDFLPVSVSVALQHVDRLPFVMTALGRELLAWGRWSLLWPLTILAVIRIARDSELARWRLLAPVMAALLALYSGIYIFSAWPSLPLHVVTSLPRLLLPVAMPAVLAVAVAIPRFQMRKRNPEELPPDSARA